MPRFRCNLFYVVQRQGTIATSVEDCHKDLHISVQNIYYIFLRILILFRYLFNIEQTPTSLQRNLSLIFSNRTSVS